MSAGDSGVIDMELLSVIRRWRHRDHFSIREISRRTGLSRNTVRKYLRSDSVEPRFNVPDRPSKLDPYADKLSAMLRVETGKSRKQKRTIKQLHADLAALGYDGSYNRVAAFARDWKAARQREQQTVGRGAFVPLAFVPGEAFQFDWSEDWAIIGGERTKLQVAHAKLSYSRAFTLRAYLLQTHEMLFDAHNHAFRVLGGVPRRGIFDNLWTSPAQGDLLASAAGMHESIRPVAGRIAPLALMGVRCFWPRNMIGLAGLVVDQAWKLRSLPTCHQLSPRIQNGLRFSVRALQSCGGQIVLLTREHGPGDPCRLIGERDNRPVEAAPRREPLQPLGTAIVVFGQSKHYGAGAMNHLTSEIMIGAPADPAEPRFAAGRILTRHEANPCGEFPSRAKMTTVVNRSDERCCDHRTDAWQLREPPAGFVSPAKSHELSVELVESEIEGADFIE